jgi:hypothetical protein
MAKPEKKTQKALATDIKKAGHRVRARLFGDQKFNA